LRLDIDISGQPGDDGDLRAVQDAAQLGARLGRMRFDYPDQMLARVKVDNGDGTYDCDRPGTNILMRRVPVESLTLVTPIAVGMTVLVRFYNRDRSKPRIVQIAGGLNPEGTQDWPAYRQSYSRTNALEGNRQDGTPSASDLGADDPVQWRHGEGYTYVWRETAAPAFYLRKVTEDGFTQVTLDKVWHDIILSTDAVVGMNSAASSGLTGGLPVHFAHTSGQICVECRSKDDLSLNWQHCLETFTVTVEDEGGIGVG